MNVYTPKRVVVTGLGGICNLGHNHQEIWDEVVAGRPHMVLIDGYAGEDWTVKFGAPVLNWDGKDRIKQMVLKRLDRFAAFGLYASIEAVEDCKIDFSQEDPFRCGVVIGSGVGGIESINESSARMVARGPRRITPFLIPKLMVNACSGNVSIRFGLRGPNSATATACASGGNAIGDAFQLIQDGDADVMVAGGAEAAMSPLCVAGFMVMKALSTRNDDPNGASRPFDRDRDGFVMAEGAGIIILEELEHALKRNAPIYAEICGYGSSGDANHITAPDPCGVGAARSISSALKDANITPDKIDYINAHGTSTPLGDAAEVKAVKTVFGDSAKQLTMSSTKSMTGHSLGASGGVESLIVCKAIKHQICPPTANLDNPDEEFDGIDFAPKEAKDRKIQYALNNSFGFGGHNVSLVFAKYDG